MAINDIVQAAINAGFQGEALVTAVAIAGAEGSYRPDAVGDNGNSYGSWQVYLPAHPSYTAAQMLDPAQNARAAYEISGGGQNFQPWTTYVNGAFRAHLDEARAAIAASTAGGPAADTASPAAGQISQLLGFLTQQLGKPYVYGGSGPDSWDCSGLTLGAYSLLGISLPHDAAVQAQMGTPVAVDPAAVQPGDLVFKFGDGVENGHVGVAVDSQSYIVAPHTGDVVKVSPIPWDQVTAVRRFVTGSVNAQNVSYHGGLTWIPGPIGGMIPVPSFGGNSLGDAFNSLKGVADAVLNIDKAIINTTKWISSSHNILRVIQVVAGVGGVFMGLRVIAAGTPLATIANAGLEAPANIAKGATKASLAMAAPEAAAALKAGGAAKPKPKPAPKPKPTPKPAATAKPGGGSAAATAAPKALPAGPAK